MPAIRAAQRPRPINRSGDYTNMLRRRANESAPMPAYISVKPDGSQEVRRTVEATQHWSDCSVHNEPAFAAGECDCGGMTPGDMKSINPINATRR